MLSVNNKLNEWNQQNHVNNIMPETQTEKILKAIFPMRLLRNMVVVCLRQNKRFIKIMTWSIPSNNKNYNKG